MVSAGSKGVAKDMVAAGLALKYFVCEIYYAAAFTVRALADLLLRDVCVVLILFLGGWCAQTGDESVSGEDRYRSNEAGRDIQAAGRCAAPSQRGICIW